MPTMCLDVQVDASYVIIIDCSERMIGCRCDFLSYSTHTVMTKYYKTLQELCFLPLRQKRLSAAWEPEVEKWDTDSDGDGSEEEGEADFSVESLTDDRLKLLMR